MCGVQGLAAMWLFRARENRCDVGNGFPCRISIVEECSFVEEHSPVLDDDHNISYLRARHLPGHCAFARRADRGGTSGVYENMCRRLAVVDVLLGPGT